MSCELTTAEVAYIDKRIAELQSENERLRERIHELEMEGSKAFYNEAYTRDENAKLRELVRGMAHVLRADDEWQDPFYCNPYCADQFRCRSDDCVEVECPIVKNMRELGVEV